MLNELAVLRHVTSILVGRRGFVLHHPALHAKSLLYNNYNMCSYHIYSIYMLYMLCNICYAIHVMQYICYICYSDISYIRGNYIMYY